jgi:hypothetical protein
MLMSTPSDRLSTEIAHVLFMDMVGYSRFSMEEQARLARELRTIVRGTPEFQRAEVTGELLALDTGDGMALFFFVTRSRRCNALPKSPVSRTATSACDYAWASTAVRSRA